eukprot:Plantae.Rhodophyta-Purpureofilum_apyrenoidigerum.ctg6098.p1 GENE.Plantae.Rhodophyta-Purpureofilum_apyrenoidigerum.ctg6098~~Plantae.Rhodophyta-Purpureofilum_apyrenoidigerum.ctg6098.p1  ORF type:complete len:706 (+),score=158.04 Plantae.Rhodophyta-Purpureofilum_apyrenoidigerum.ctg6098:102-2120(+)
MVVYNFRQIRVVPSAKDFVDIVLSKTQRKTPTVVHKGYKISRIRSFYMRKVKYTQQSFFEKLSQILEDFPNIDEMHPFYSDLLNVLYDKDHYKLALGQLAKARSSVNMIAKDYLRLLKYGDSLYRCKQLKRAALGRMCTLVKRFSTSLGYLEQVRQHMSRLPSIDPSTRTLLIAGFPNVGKSSFINRVTRADVDVQPYAFTTKSLFVGHMDYKYLRWQVIDTPGILDKMLEDRNTIEMQSITALAHLRATVMFFIDPSETCGYTLTEQVSLFKSLVPLFVNKPVVLVANKTDLGWESSLTAEDRKTLDSLVKSENGESQVESGCVADIMLKMSAQDETGVMEVRNTACDLLLKQRVESKIRNKRSQWVLDRLHVAMPATTRSPNIPQSVVEARSKMESDGASDNEMDPDHTEMDDTSIRKLEKDLQWELGGPGVYSADWRKQYKLRNDEWAYDIIPEIVDGKNICDFVDPDIENKLEELEREEEARETAVEMLVDDDADGEDLTAEDLTKVQAIREKKAMVRAIRIREKTKNRPTISHAQKGKLQELSGKDLKDHLETIGMDEEDVDEVSGKMLQNSKSRKRGRADADIPEDLLVEEMEREGIDPDEAREGPRGRQGIASAQQRAAARSLKRKQQKIFKRTAKKGEGDRSIPTKKPKHLYSGKTGLGSSSRR